MRRYRFPVELYNIWFFKHASWSLVGWIIQNLIFYSFWIMSSSHYLVSIPSVKYIGNFSFMKSYQEVSKVTAIRLKLHNGSAELSVSPAPYCQYWLITWSGTLSWLMGFKVTEAIFQLYRDNQKKWIQKFKIFP